MNYFAWEDTPYIFNEDESNFYKRGGKLYDHFDRLVDAKTILKKERLMAEKTSRLKAKFNLLKGTARRVHFFSKRNVKNFISACL